MKGLNARVLVVDDEAMARRGIRARLEQFGDMNIVGECANGRQAVQAIRDKQPELVFLDVQMPGMTGFDVVREIGPENMPAIIFVTAYDQYAIKAFGIHALDYLLKPIDDDRFQSSVERALGRIREKRQSGLAERLSAMINEGTLTVKRPGDDDQTPKSEPKRFMVKSAGRISFVNVGDIRLIEASGDYVELNTPEKTYLYRATMADMEKELGDDGFLRIHRSLIINTSAIVQLKHHRNGEYDIELNGGNKVRSGRKYHQNLSVFLNSGLR